MYRCRVQIRICINVFLLVGLLLCNVSHSYESEPYLYSDPFNPSDAYVVNINEKYVSEGDLRFKAEICKAESDYICFKSKALSFAVPKVIENKNSWVVKDVKYKLLSQQAFSLYGKKATVYKIGADSEDIKYEFLYSQENGLIGIQLNYQGKSKSYFLEYNCGFGAYSGCDQL